MGLLRSTLKIKYYLGSLRNMMSTSVDSVTERGPADTEKDRARLFESDATESDPLEFEVSSKSFCKSLKSALMTGSPDQIVSWFGFT